MAPRWPRVKMVFLLFRDGLEKKRAARSQGVETRKRVFTHRGLRHEDVMITEFRGDNKLVSDQHVLMSGMQRHTLRQLCVLQLFSVSTCVEFNKRETERSASCRTVCECMLVISSHFMETE